MGEGATSHEPGGPHMAAVCNPLSVRRPPPPPLRSLSMPASLGSAAAGQRILASPPFPQPTPGQGFAASVPSDAAQPAPAAGSAAAAAARDAVIWRVLPAVTFTLVAACGGCALLMHSLQLMYAIAASSAVAITAAAGLTGGIAHIIEARIISVCLQHATPAHLPAVPHPAGDLEEGLAGGALGGAPSTPSVWTSTVHRKCVMLGGTQSAETQRWARSVVRVGSLSSAAEVSVVHHTLPVEFDGCQNSLGEFDEASNTSTLGSTLGGGSESGSSSTPTTNSLLLASALRINSLRHVKNKVPQVRRATVLVTGVPSAACIAVASPEVFAAQLSHVMSRITEVVSRNQGTLHAAMGETVVASFGTTRYKYSHIQAAASAALQLKALNLGAMQQAVPSTASPQRAEGDAIVPSAPPAPAHCGATLLTVGLASGDMLCGVMGSDVWKNHTVIGAPLNRALSLQHLCSTIGVRALVDQEVKRGCIDCMVMRFGDAVGWKGASGFEAVYELLSSRAANSKEWMYYDETPYDQAVQHLMKQEFDQAEQMFAAHLSSTTTVDMNAQRLQSLAVVGARAPFSLL